MAKRQSDVPAGRHDWEEAGMAANRLRPSDNCWPPSTQADNFAAGSAPFSMIVDQSDPTVTIISVLDDIDMATASPLQDQLSRLIVTAPERLIIDLTHVSFWARRRSRC